MAIKQLEDAIITETEPIPEQMAMSQPGILPLSTGARRQELFLFGRAIVNEGGTTKVRSFVLCDGRTFFYGFDLVKGGRSQPCGLASILSAGSCVLHSS
ncbi:MAG TPA: hypothetical protein VGL94_15450 [Ktedonobacteraceae bacterium]